jgi:ATP-binding cassette, subfamily B, multidrug efflux pump
LQPTSRSRRRDPNQPRQKGTLGRAIRYLGKFRSQAAIPYIFLVIATLAQLAVPKMVGNLIDAISQGVIYDQILAAMQKIPAAFLPKALPQLQQALASTLTCNGQPATGLSATQFTACLQTAADAAPRALVIAAIAILIFAVVRGIFSFLQVFYAEKNSQGVAFEMRNDLYAKVQKLSFSYHDRNQTGQLMVRATDDVEKVRLFIGQGLLQLVGAFLLIVGTLIILFNTNARLTLIVLPILPAALILFMIFGTISQPLFAKLQVRLSALNTILQENLAGIKLIKAFTREKNEQVKFDKSATNVMNQQIVLSRTFAFLFPLVFLIANLGQAGVLYFGGRQIIYGTLSIGQWQEFSLYLIYLFLPLAQFGIIITQMGQASASSGRVFEILDAKNDVIDKPDAITLPVVDGQVGFENVTFRYLGTSEAVLNNVSFTALPGQTIALLGATGSGKTSIINLIPRFYDPSEGRITIDGHDLRDITLDSLRSQIGIVLQETTLFSGTIRDNIAFGRSDATMEDIEAAARAAAAHDFIMSFPAGYETSVGERGSTLSGGQKQRVAIARALLLNPRILILDDSTSSVDMATEAEIQRALDTLMKGRTSFVIAQRISTVINADQILVLNKGQIVANGKHADLLEDSPVYAEIYNSQLISDVALAEQPAA